jgi:hypothetical protein
VCVDDHDDGKVSTAYPYIGCMGRLLGLDNCN